MNVLIACEESQTVCKAFRELEHSAYSCDIQDCSGGHPEWHIKGDAIALINGNCDFITMDGIPHYQDGPWDLLIAHPPCTYLSSVSASRLFASDHSIKDLDREKKGWEAREFFMKFYNCSAKRIAIENPAPLKYFNLPKRSQIVEPYYFGDPWKKRTCLWLIGLPDLVPDKLVQPLGCWVVQGGGKSCRIKLKGSMPIAHSAKDRSKTFPGVARAMAQQWGATVDLA